MRCYLMRGGHIVSVEMLPGLSDQEAIEQSHRIFAERAENQYDGFELWDMARVVTRHLGSEPPISLKPVT